ncbi:nucleoside 5-triphosphatase RdgB [Acetivibrio straminisolvens JCM 21531]|uniref:Nucleoside 5-triphosphatase RdgB n=3 Tax=Acetivibrio straminisolvens TaxID=253314 RepID=W4V1E4_9FIRM|nr:nucleoside 5-triphosphatase RdgB [Acetivibrio straminisolvens JCM 21531]
MRKFVIATKNRGKLKEIEEILDGLNFQVVSMEEVGITKDIEESGSTFEENA